MGMLQDLFHDLKRIILAVVAAVAAIVFLVRYLDSDKVVPDPLPVVPVPSPDVITPNNP